MTIIFLAVIFVGEKNLFVGDERGMVRERQIIGWLSVESNNLRQDLLYNISYIIYG